MSLIFRLARTGIQRQLLSARRCAVVTMPMAQKSGGIRCEGQASDEGHDVKNMRLGRPQSPHLTIYAPQWTTMLSISHRAFGMILSGYIVLFALGALVLPESYSNYIDDLECWGIGFIPIAIGKLMLCFPLVYHYFNGIRHLIWDSGRCLNLSQVYLTGYIMLLVALATTGFLCYI